MVTLASSFLSSEMRADSIMPAEVCASRSALLSSARA